MLHSIPKPIAVVVCYPSNPTACVADLDFYRDLVAFAKKHGLLVLSDLAYAEVYFDNNPPPSLLQVPGAMDVAVEFTSMSKTYSMPGWRIGFAVGNERLIAALARVKSYLDYGAFTPIQVAATAALNGPDDCIDEMRAIYRRRRDALVDSFGRAGWHVPPPAASMFAWAPIPEPFRPLGSVEFSTLLVEKAGVAVSPGAGFGEYGEGHVRIALVENEQRIRQAARNIRRFLETGPESCTTSFRSRRDVSPGVVSAQFWRRLMAQPLKVGLAGLGTVGAAVVELLAARPRQARGALRPADRDRRGHRALAGEEARLRPQEIPLGRRSGGAGARSGDRRVCRTHRRRGRSGQARRSKPRLPPASRS